MDQNELFDRLVENDTISDTIKDTISSLSDNERTVFEEMQINPNVTVNELSEMLDINLRNTKNVIETLKENGVENGVEKGVEKVGEEVVRKGGQKGGQKR